MHLFYTPDISGTDYQLNEEESRHCVKVLRLGAGDVVHLIDGRGGFYRARIVLADPRGTMLTVEEHQSGYGKRNHYLHIAIAPTKNIERLEWFLEKATEIGIDEITPLICDRSERRDVKTSRLNKIITSAVKQSLKAYHPKLNEPIKFKDFIMNTTGQKFIAHCMDGEKLALKQCLEPCASYTVLIGPEGDFTPSELAMSKENSFIAVSLGTSRLRTETAGLEACFEVNFLNR